MPRNRQASRSIAATSSRLALSACPQPTFSSCLDLGMFSKFGRTGAPQKGTPQATDCRTAARLLWPVRAPLWRVATFKSSLCAARHYTPLCLYGFRIQKGVYWVSGIKTSSKTVYSCDAELTVSFCALMSENLRENRPAIFFPTGPNRVTV